MISREEVIKEVFRHDVSRHEAGHAVVAAYLRLSLVNVSLNTNHSGDLSFLPGQPNGVVNHLDWRPSFDIEQNRNRIRKHIIVSFAGEAAEKSNLKLYPDSGAGGDMKLIYKLLRYGKMSKRELPALKRRAEKIVLIPFVKAAILEVARQLEERPHLMTGQQVRGILAFERSFHKHKKEQKRTGGAHNPVEKS